MTERSTTPDGEEPHEVADGQSSPPAPAPAQDLDRVTTLIRQIEDNRGPGGLDLSGVNFSDLDLSENSLCAAEGPFDGPAVWRTSRLGRPGINLVGATLDGAFLPRANLSYARMQLCSLAAADLYGANLQGADMYRADLRGAAMYKANLRSAKLERADLSGADLQLADMTGANLLRARLDGTLFNRVSIGPRLIQEDAAAYAAYVDDDGKLHDFALARALQPSVSREHLYMLDGRARIRSAYEVETSRRHVEIRYLEARDIYLALKACFEQQSLPDDASWAHYRGRQMQRKSLFPGQARHCYAHDWPSGVRWTSPSYWLVWLRYFMRWLANHSFELTCGYGERPSRTVASILLVFAICTFLTSRWSDFGHGTGTEPFANYLLFSLGSLASVGFNDLSPVNTAGKVIGSVESVLGISLFALLMFTLGNKMGRG